MNYRSFFDLDVYKHCRQHRIQVSNLLSEGLPRDEKYRLLDQILRASRSITANIAEGYGRHYYMDNVRFCRNARGSLEECLEHIITAYDESYISQEDYLKLKSKNRECLRLLNGYIKYLKKMKQAG